jgi:HEAT repeat protein
MRFAEASAPLRDSLKDDEPSVVQAVAEALQSHPTSEVLRSLLVCLEAHKKNHLVRQTILQTVYQISWEAKDVSVIDSLKELLFQEEDAPCAKLAVDTIARLDGDKGRKALQSLADSERFSEKNDPPNPKRRFQSVEQRIVDSLAELGVRVI